MYKIFQNSGWLLIDKISKLFPGIIVLALISRHLGPETFGIWNYAIALATITGSFTLLGMDKIAVKELINNSEQQESIVATIICMRIIAGILAMAVSVAIVVTAKNGDPVYIYCTVISSLMIILQAFDVFDYFYQAKNNVRKVIIPKVCVFLAFCAIKIIAISLNGTLTTFLWLSLLELGCTYMIILGVYRYHYSRGFLRSLDMKLGKELLKQGWPLLFSNMVVVLFVKIDLLLLDGFGNTQQVGEYVAAARISELWYAIPAVLSAAMLPGLIHKKNTSEQAYLATIEKWLRLSFWSSVSISLLVMMMAKTIMPLLYGSRYTASSQILMIHIWASIPVFLCCVFVNHLIIEGNYKINLYANILGLVANIGINILLIPTYGGVGAAIATVISYTAVYGALVLFDKSRKGIMLTRRMIHPGLVLSDMRKVYDSLRSYLLKPLLVREK